MPDWVYTDDAVYQREVERIFHEPHLEYVALEAEIPTTGDFIRSMSDPRQWSSRAARTAQST